MQGTDRTIREFKINEINFDETVSLSAQIIQIKDPVLVICKILSSGLSFIRCTTICLVGAEAIH